MVCTSLSAASDMQWRAEMIIFCKTLQSDTVTHLENGAVLSRSLLCPYQVLNQGC